MRASDRIKFVDIECERKICIFDVQTSDIGEYEYRVKSGHQELSMTACLDAIEIIVEKPKEPPKLYLNLSASREIIIRAGNKLAVDIPISKDLAKRDGKQKFDDGDGKRIQVRYRFIAIIKILLILIVYNTVNEICIRHEKGSQNSNSGFLPP